MYNDKMIVFFDNRNKEILTTVTPNNTQFDLDSFFESRFEHDDNFKRVGRENIRYEIIDKYMYQKEMSYMNSNIKGFIDKETNKFIFEIHKRDAIPNRNRSYSDYPYRRDYSLEEVKRMYEEDYIGVNLRNIIKTGIIKAEFIPIKDLNIRSTITQKTWRQFVNDPFLHDAHDDKLKLGRSIMEIGTWYPFVVAPMSKDDNKLYVFEGNHRIVSLKLLAMSGEISEDFKVMCLRLPLNFKTYKLVCKDIVLPSPVKYRYILEDMYGCDLLVSDELLKKTLNAIKEDGEVMVNDYTVEATTTLMSDILGVVHAYPIFLRDLIYLHDSKVKPSPIINNEEVFKKWIES